MNVQGRIVLVTGASSGIGAATAKAMARQGGRVLLLARTQTALEQVADDIRAQNGEASVYPVDLADLAALERVAQTISTDIGTPDILVNIAGVGRWLFTEETRLEEAMQMLAVPYLAALALTRAFMPAMLQRKSGHIVNITSPIAYFAWPGATAFTASRWAMRGLTEALRADLYGTGIRVTLVVPAVTRTPYFEHNPGVQERLPKIATTLIPTLKPEHVAHAIVGAVEHNRRVVMVPWLLKLTILGHTLLPRLVEWMLIKTGWKRVQEHA
jgi:uncharacterized protein